MDIMGDPQDIDELHTDEESEEDVSAAEQFDDDNEEEEEQDVEASEEGSDDEMEDEMDEEEGEDEESSEDGDEEDGDESMRPANDRASLRKMMASESANVLATLTSAAIADAAKGQAVKQQRSTFDQLLNTRIRLQRALVSTNSVEPEQLKDARENEPEQKEAVYLAEEAALKLWNSLNSLRTSLAPSAPKGKPTIAKRKTRTDVLWAEMQKRDSEVLANRNATLEKWSQKVRGIDALPTSHKLNNSSASARQSITAVLNGSLRADEERLVARTKVARSCAPLQAAAAAAAKKSGSGPKAEVEIFDDADFYQLLLKELVDSRMDAHAGVISNSQSAAGTALAVAPMREAKTRKAVDTKASKGRKMRYTVHEKLQNFMAPHDLGDWGERQRDELFGSLLGARRGLGENASDDEEDQANDGGLRLFGGV
jgi:protein AATF/BFR2